MKRLLLCITLITSSTAFASSSTPTEELRQLIAKEDFTQAYQLAIRFQTSHEGVPDFDYYFGIAAVDSGHIDEAIFAFERVLALEPGHQAARLELARAYFMVGQYEQSSLLFHEVASLNPPLSVQAKVDQYLAAISSRSANPAHRTRGYISLGTGYDDNINAGPDGDGALSLTDIYGNQYNTLGVTGKDDHFRQLEGHILHQRRINHDWSSYFQGRFEARWYNDESSLDNVSVNVRVGATRRYNNGYTRFSIFAHSYHLDNSDYRTLYGVNAEYKYAFSNQLLFGPFIQVNRLEYESGYRDSRLVLAGVSGSWSLSDIEGGRVNASLYAGQEKPDDSSTITKGSVKRDLGGVMVSMSIPVGDDVVLSGSTSYERSTYDSAYFLLTPLTVDSRKDKKFSARLQADWTFAPSMQVFGRYSFTDNESNTQLTDYLRRQFTVGIRYRF